MADEDTTATPSSVFKYFSSSQEALQDIRNFEVATKTKFVTWLKSKEFGCTDPSIKGHKILWREQSKIQNEWHKCIRLYDQTPFFVNGEVIMECQFASDKHDSWKKLKKKRESESAENSQKKKRRITQASKKCGCPAKIYLKDVIKFPDYRIGTDTSHFRKMASKKIRSNIESGKEIRKERRIYVSYPHDSVHLAHPIHGKFRRVKRSKPGSQKSGSTIKNKMAANEDEEPEPDVFYCGDSRPFYDDMKMLLDNNQFSDVDLTFSEDGQITDVIHAHKCILASRCELFRNLFNENDAVDEYPIEGISAEIFRILLEFIYTNGCSNINCDNVFHLLSAANKIGLFGLNKVCEDFLLKNVKLETVCESMEAAVTFGLEKLKKDLMLYFEGHTLDVLKRTSIIEMSAPTLAYILQSDKLNIDELEVYRIIRDWSTVNAVALDQPISEVAKDVAQSLRLSLFTSEELSKIETENKDRLIPVEMISQAWRHLALKTFGDGRTEATPRRGTKKRNKET